MIVISLFFIALFLRLGFWQLERAEEKEQMLASQADLLKKNPVWLDTQVNPPLQYQPIKAKGYYLPELFLLDNQHHNHQFGYDVLSPLVLSNGRVVLVDRGWVSGDQGRQSVPKVSTPVGLTQIQGSIYYPAQNQWVLGPGIEEKESRVRIIERIDTKLVEQILQKTVYPFIIRLDKQDAYGFVREWAIVSMPPQRHLGYALQWFVMALVILIIFVALNLKKKNEETHY